MKNTKLQCGKIARQCPSDLFIDWLCDSQFQFTRSVPFVLYYVTSAVVVVLGSPQYWVHGSDRQSSGYVLSPQPDPTSLSALLLSHWLHRAIHQSIENRRLLPLSQSLCGSLAHISFLFYNLISSDISGMSIKLLNISKTQSRSSGIYIVDDAGAKKAKRKRKQYATSRL